MEVAGKGGELGLAGAVLGARRADQRRLGLEPSRAGELLAESLGARVAVLDVCLKANRISMVYPLLDAPEGRREIYAY